MSAMIPVPGEGKISNAHPLHDYLSDIIVFLVAVTHVATKGNPPPEPFNVGLQCDAAGIDLGLVCHGHTEAMMTGTLPGEIELFFQHQGVCTRDIFVRRGTTRIPHERFVSALFSLYVERCSDWIKANRSTNYHSWPPVANFCRVVRNAIAHGGTININSERAPVVAWRSLTYSHADHGRRIINTGSDLSTGDLIVLMLELAMEMSIGGAPNPLP